MNLCQTYPSSRQSETQKMYKVAKWNVKSIEEITKRSDRQKLPIRRFKFKVSSKDCDLDFCQNGWPILISGFGEKLFFIQNVKVEDLPFSKEFWFWETGADAIREATFEIDVPLNIQFKQKSDMIIVPFNQFDRSIENEELLIYLKNLYTFFHGTYKYGND